MAYDFTNPFGMVQSQPSLNLPTGLISTTPQQKLNPMAGGKNETLALMLNALGGALRGDKDFMQNTLQLQQMQEGKRRAAEKKAAYDRQYNLLSDDQKKIVDRQNAGIDLPPAKDRRIVLQNGVQYYADTGQPVIPNAPGKTKTKSDYVVGILEKIQDDPGYLLTTSDQRILDTISDTDPMKSFLRNRLNEMQTSKFSNENNNQSELVTVTTQKEFDDLPTGTTYIYNGTEYVKGK